MRTLLWFRGRDFRVEDQPALAAAAEGDALIPLVVRDSAESAAPFRCAFEEAALGCLDAALRARGSRLVVMEGDAETVVLEGIHRWSVDRVEAMARVEPHWRERDDRVGARLGHRYRLHVGDTLAAPGAVRTAGGGPFAVFTPFARAFARQVDMQRPLGAPRTLAPLPPELQDLPGWTKTGASEPAGDRMASFLHERLEGYATGRNALGGDGISRLSADLRAGTLSVRGLWRAVSTRMGHGFDDDVRAYLNELLWREFAHHVLWERPELVSQPFRPVWRNFPWRSDAGDLEAWKAGRTGYPVVDAAARELLATGFVHNRARMVAASFLTKHLMLDWRSGEAHYRTFLVDGCEAANSLNWQWSAGCGVDAQPWFRIFHPTTQGRKFDPDGAYVRRWLPELQEVPDRFLLTPHTWGKPLDYPLPIVDHAAARARFLAAAKGCLGA